MPFRIGYAGLGSLGSAIFPNLVSYASEHGFPAPSVWNRSQGQYSSIKEQFPDVHTAENLLELLDCNVVFTCLANDAAAEDVYGQLVNGLNEGNGKGRAGYRQVIFADQSTLKVKTTRMSDLLTPHLEDYADGRRVTCSEDKRTGGGCWRGVPHHYGVWPASSRSRKAARLCQLRESQWKEDRGTHAEGYWQTHDRRR